MRGQDDIKKSHVWDFFGMKYEGIECLYKTEGQTEMLDSEDYCVVLYACRLNAFMSRQHSESVKCHKVTIRPLDALMCLA